MAKEAMLKEVRRRPRKLRRPDAPNKVSQTKLRKRVFSRKYLVDRVDSGRRAITESGDSESGRSRRERTGTGIIKASTGSSKEVKRTR